MHGYYILLISWPLIMIEFPLSVAWGSLLPLTWILTLQSPYNMCDIYMRVYFKIYLLCMSVWTALMSVDPVHA